MLLGEQSRMGFRCSSPIFLTKFKQQGHIIEIDTDLPPGRAAWPGSVGVGVSTTLVMNLIRMAKQRSIFRSIEGKMLKRM